MWYTIIFKSDIELYRVLNKSVQESLILNYYKIHVKLNNGITTIVMDLLIG